MILSRLSRQFKTNYVTYEIYLLKHLKRIFLCLAFMMSSFYEDFWYHTYFPAVLFKCKNYSSKRENDKNKVMLGDVPHILLLHCFRSILLFHEITQPTSLLSESKSCIITLKALQ